MQNDYLPEEIAGGSQYPYALMQVEQSRAVEEVQAAMVIAKKFPRDELKAEAKILKECERKSLAEVSQYAYPRGGTNVTGPSIRLAEVMARCWGNMVYGLTELSQHNGVSDVIAYAWDLETNTKASRQFTVKHIRQKKSGNVELADPRDIYEIVASQGQRRVRACILEVIPGDIQDKAVEQCNKTLKSAYTEPLEDRIAKMIRAFDKIGVNQSALEKRLNHDASIITETEIAGLKKIYQSITDGMSDRTDWFDLSSGQGETVRDRISESQKKRLDAQITRTDIKVEKEDEPEEVAFRDQYINLKHKGFGPWVIKNKEGILAHSEHWEEIRIKWLKHYGEEPFPFPLRRDVKEPTEEQIEEQAPPPQEITNIQTAPEIENPPSVIPEEEPDLDTYEGWTRAMNKIIETDRNKFFTVRRQLGFGPLAEIKENERKSLYFLVKSAMEEGVHSN